MEHANQYHEADRRILGGLIAAAALIVGGLSGSLLAAGIAGAANRVECRHLDGEDSQARHDPRKR